MSGFSASGSGDISETIFNSGATAETVTYTVTPTGPAPGSCVGAPVDFVVTVNPAPVIPLGTYEVCAGGFFATTTNITASGGSGTPASPAWTVIGGDGSVTLSNENTNTVTVTGVSNGDGTVNLLYTDDAGCSVPVSVTVNPIPAPVVNNSGPYCEGDLIELDAEPSGETFYSWTGPNSYSNNSNTEDPTIASATTAMAGDYTVVITNSFGCSFGGTTDVVVNALPVVTQVSDFTVCSGSPDNINVGLSSDQDPDVSYSWTVNNLSLIHISEPTRPY